jgi:hypothetical protein
MVDAITSIADLIKSQAKPWFIGAGRLAALLACALAPTAPARAADTFSSVYINEFLADNQHSMKDNNGDYSGWIELYNGGSEPLNLGGWFLTDTPTNLTKWRFPVIGLLPGNYVVVFASGKGRTNDLAHLHTNFHLRKEGGYLALVTPSAKVISEFAPYPKQSADVSYGRVRGEPDVSGYFAQPSHGRANESGGPGFAPAVVFSRASSSFTEPFLLELSCPSTNAVICYTLDGQLPNRESGFYHAPISVTNTMSVRARAYQDGLLPGPPQTQSFLLLATNVTRFSSSLPILVMDTLGSHQSTSARSSFVQLSFYEPVNGRSSLTNAPALSTRAGFHIRGSTSASMPQSGFAVQLLDEFDHELHLPVLDLPANSDWVLYAPNAFDPIMIHNPFIHQLSRDLGRYSPRTRFLEAYLVRHRGAVTSHDYYGIFVLEEKIKVGRHRVAIDRLGPEDLKPPEVTGGYLLKLDRLGPGEGGFWAGGANMVFVEPKEPVIQLPQRAPQLQYLTEYFDEFERALEGPDWKDPVKGYRAYIDVDSWIDFHVLEVLSGNVDAFAFSTYFYKPRGGKITFGPHWDFDRALGSIDQRDSYPRRWNTGRFFDGPWVRRLFSDRDFWQLWVDRWQQLRQTTFSETNLFALIDRLTGELRQAQPRQVRRWGLEPRGGSYQSEIDLMKDWLTQRMDFIDQQLTQPPQFSRPRGQVAAGFQLTLNVADGATAYYTLDGSDPRLSQGGLSSNAVQYAGPITLKGDARVVARARNQNKHQSGGPHTSTPWSGPARADFTVKP